MEEHYEIKLKCIFCGSSDFELPHADYQPEDGETIKCGNCGRENDYASIRDYAVNKKLEEIQKEMLEPFKKMGFKVE